MTFEQNKKQQQQTNKQTNKNKNKNKQTNKQNANNSISYPKPENGGQILHLRMANLESGGR